MLWDAVYVLYAEPAFGPGQAAGAISQSFFGVGPGGRYAGISQGRGHQHRAAG